MRWLSAVGIVILYGAGGLWPGHLQAQEALPKPGQYSHPNETQPGDLVSILHQAPQGAYVSVGTERGLMSASLSSRFTALILADIDPGIVYQNKLNLALILMSGGDRQEYQRLRLSADRDAWTTAARKANLPDDLRRAIENPEAWSWWSQHIRSSRKFLPFHTPAGPGHTEFRDANYLFSDAQFSRLYRMASAGNIAILQADLSDSVDLERIAKEIDKRKMQLSILDISNVADKIPAPMRAVLEKMGKAFARVSHAQGLLVETHREVVISHSAKLWKDDWIYHGYSLADLNDRTKRKLVVELIEGVGQSGNPQGACLQRKLQDLVYFSSK